MLYSYPAPSRESNWLHDFLIGLLKEALKSQIDQLPSQSFEALIPPEHRSELRSRTGLKTRYSTVLNTTRTLDIADAQQALDLLDESSYPATLSGRLAYRVEAFASSSEFQSAVHSLFAFGFDLLSKLPDGDDADRSIRDALYERAYKAMPDKICPFCGLDRFDAPHPQLPRHHLDHYLPLSGYPIFGAYLANLVPMCARCNSSFKSAIDIVTSPDGTARACVDPYAGPVATVSLAPSSPFGSIKGDHLPSWVIEFDPKHTAFETWDAVFGVRLRYRESILDANYRDWLEDFGRFAHMSQSPLGTGAEMNAALTQWASLSPSLRDLGFLKGPLFRMLALAVLRPDETGARTRTLISNVCAASR